MPFSLSTSKRTTNSPSMPLVAILACWAMLGVKLILQMDSFCLTTVETGGPTLPGAEQDVNNGESCNYFTLTTCHKMFIKDLTLKSGKTGTCAICLAVLEAKFCNVIKYFNPHQ